MLIANVLETIFRKTALKGNGYTSKKRNYQIVLTASLKIGLLLKEPFLSF